MKAAITCHHHIEREAPRLLVVTVSAEVVNLASGWTGSRNRNAGSIDENGGLF